MKLIGNEVVGSGRKSVLGGLTKASTKMAEKEGANIAKKLVVDEISEKTPSVIRVFTKDNPMSLQEAYERTASMRNAHASNKRMLTEASGKELYKNFPNDFMELDNSNPYAKKLFGDYDNAISREIGSENASKLRNILGNYARLDNKDFEGSRNMVKNFLNSKDGDAVVNKSRDLLEDAGVYRAHNSPDGISWTTKPSVAMQYIDESLHPDGTKILEGEIHPNNRVIAPQFTERYQPALAQHEVIGDPSGIQQVGKTKMVELLKGEGINTNDINVANALRYMKPKNGGNYGHLGRAGEVGGSLPKVQYSMADEGMPIRVYHSTPNEFDKFDDAMLGSNTGHENTKLGHFVTTDKEFSKKFLGENGSGRTMELEANIKNPITHPYMAGLKYEGEELDNIVAKYLEATDNQELLQTLSEYAKENGTSLYDEYMDLTVGETSPFEFAEDERKLLQSKGYDAAEVIEGMRKDLLDSSTENVPVSSYAVFDSNNLKPVVADSYNDPNIEKAIKQSGADKYLGEPKVNYSLADDADAGLSPAQREFFKDSVVRDENGNLIPMYHGTRGDFTIFGDKSTSSSSNGHSSVGYWFSPNEEGAKNFANSIWYGDGQPKAMKTYLNIKNPKVYESVDNSKAVGALRDKLAELELQAKSNSSYPELYYKNMYHASVVDNMVRQGNKDMAIKWLSEKSGYDDKTATDLVEEIADRRNLEIEKKKLEDELDELKHSDAYERFRTDLYKIDGQKAGDANVGGIGMSLNDKNSVQKYVDKLKSEGYDGIIIKGTHYDSDTMGGINDQYVVFDPEQIKDVDNLNPTTNPDIRYSKGDSLTDIANRIKAMNKAHELDNGVKRIGSGDVAEIDANTLPAGYNTIKKYLEADPNAMVEKAVGAKVDDYDVFPDKLRQWIEDEGYEAKPNVVDNLNIARRIVAEQTLDELNMEGASGYRKFLETRSGLQKDNPGKGVGPRSFTISANKDQLYQTDAAKLDREYSDRLGIGRSHTPMSDKVLSSDAQGYYMGGGIGINPLHASGESGVSTVAHERLHAWQDINSGDWDSRVGDAIDELRAELKKHYHTKDQIKEYRKSRSDLDYYADSKEQEARMLQSYLDNEGYTKTWRKQSGEKTEWGDEVKPAFDKFFKKLRALSKKGVALPAVAGLVGIGALAGEKDNKKLDNIK